MDGGRQQEGKGYGLCHDLCYRRACSHSFPFQFTSLGQHSACISFVDVAGAGSHLKASKKVEAYRHHCVFLDVRVDSPLLVTPMGPPEKTSRWTHKKLTELREGPVLKGIIALGDARLMGTMVIKEFLQHRIVLLQVHLYSVWEFTSGREPMRLHVSGLTHDELDGALGDLLGSDPEELPHAMPLLYAYDDMKELVTEIPVFDE
ncbi:hypothetical protein D1007_25339 [Hordeum vulgare]|nr:hypothetical protein D1007_25339 [Hordeum vulgare]